MQLQAASQAPVIVEMDGEKYEFPRLNGFDFGKWCAELAPKLQAAAKKDIPPNTPPMERYKINRAIDFDLPNLDHIARIVLTPDGAIETLKKSWAKTKQKEDDFKKLIGMLSPGDMVDLAAEVASLWPKPLPAQPEQAGTQKTTTFADAGSGANPLQDRPPTTFGGVGETGQKPSESSRTTSPALATQGA